MAAPRPARQFDDAVDDAWRADAHCKGLTALFFSIEADDVERAQAICASCAVTAQCLEAAIENREPAGVWAGRRFSPSTAAHLMSARWRAAS